MATQILVGTTPDDGTGDTLRQAGIKINNAIFVDNVSSGVSTTIMSVSNTDQTGARINIRNTQSADAWAIVAGIPNVGQDYLSIFNVTANTTLTTFTRAGQIGVLFGADASDGGALQGANLVMTSQSTNDNAYLIGNWQYLAGDKRARIGGSGLIIFATGGTSEGLNPGEIAFSTAPTGAAGTAIAWTRQLRLHTDVLGIEALTLLTMNVGAAVGAPTSLQYIEFKQSGQAQTGGLKFTSSSGTRIVDMSGSAIRFLNIGGSVVAASIDNSGGLLCNAGFACNGIATAQTAFASGGAAPAGGVGATAGAYDTAAHRDAAITLLNNIRTALVNNGIMI